MNSCPVCGSTGYKESYQCRRLGQSVCVKCCRSCEHGWKDDFYVTWRCSYGVEEEEKRKKELGEIKGRIYELEKAQEDLYRRGRVQKAEAAAWEAAILKRKLKRLENA